MAALPTPDMYLPHRSDYWKPGSRLGKGVPLEQAPNRSYGTGTTADPFVLWSCNMRGLTTSRIAGCNMIAQQVAQEHGFLLVVIRKENHEELYERVNGRKTGLFLKADSHITFNMGNSAQDLVLQGHVYTVDDGNKVPLRRAMEDERNLLHGRPALGLELWRLEPDAAYDAFVNRRPPNRPPPPPSQKLNNIRSSYWRKEANPKEQQGQENQPPPPAGHALTVPGAGPAGLPAFNLMVNTERRRKAADNKPS